MTTFKEALFMKRSRFAEPRIFSILKESENGIKTADICRRRGNGGVDLTHNQECQIRRCLSLDHQADEGVEA